MTPPDAATGGDHGVAPETDLRESNFLHDHVSLRPGSPRHCLTPLTAANPARSLAATVQTAFGSLPPDPLLRQPSERSDFMGPTMVNVLGNECS